MRRMSRLLFTSALVLAAGLTVRADDPTSRHVPLSPISTSLPASSSGLAVQLELWDSATAGTQISTEAHTVDTDVTSNITNDTGFPDLLFGRPGGLNPADFPTGSSRYLDVTQGGVSTLTARLPMYAFPFSISPGPQAPSSPRKFYLSKNFVNGAAALTACVAGYHMASVFEIINPAVLEYDTTNGRTSADSGKGPVSLGAGGDGGGWIRTGNDSSTSNTPGVGNCSAWTSTAGSGSTAGLVLDWSTPSSNPLAPWRASSAPCSLTPNVWCVQN